MRLVPLTRKTDSPSPNCSPLDRLFENFFNDWPFGASFPRPTGRRYLLNGIDAWMPAVNVLEREGNLVLQAELPGFGEKDIDLKLEGQVLTLKGERKHESDNGKSRYHRTESFYGAFSRSFTLPDSVQADLIKAEFRNGILTVTIPQKPEVQPRQIPVSVH